MKPMSRHFGEIHGVDVSDEMIAPCASESSRLFRMRILTRPVVRIWRSLRMSRFILSTPTPSFSTFPAAMS